MENDFFHITLEMLKEDKIFPFHIHVFHPLNKKYSLFLHANGPLIKEKSDFLKLIVSKGGELAVLLNQKRTFLKATNTKEEDVPDLQERELSEFEKKRALQVEKMTNEEESFNFQEEFKVFYKNDDFLPMINSARDHILTYPLSISPSVSLAVYLAENLLIEDNFINRIVAFSFHIARVCNIKDEESLGELVTSAYFSHLGATQFDLSFSHQAQIKLPDAGKKAYKKHPGLSQHLLRKSGVEISDRCHKIILQHHERWDGSGYPDNKKESHIDQLALILGACSHLLEYNMGKVTGDKTPWNVIISNIKDHTLLPGLEIQFGDSIYEAIIYLLGSNTLKNSDKSYKVA